MDKNTIEIGAINELPTFSPQFQHAGIDALSFVTTPIELLSNDGNDLCLHHATGFYWKKGDKSYVVTNWHVLTGKNPNTGDLLSDQGYIPAKIKIFGRPPDQHFTRGPFIPTSRVPALISLNDEKVSCLQHQNFERLKIDVAIIEISTDIIGQESIGRYLNNYGFEQLYHSVGSDCFIVGYPLKNYAGTMIPIWKRGSLATEPLISIDDKPMFIVDASTMEGMSGAPIFRRTFGPVYMSDKTLRLDAAVTTEFVGIYSGRLKSREMEATNLGYAWYGNLIDEIITEGVPISN